MSWKLFNLIKIQESFIKLECAINKRNACDIHWNWSTTALSWSVIQLRFAAVAIRGLSFTVAAEQTGSSWPEEKQKNHKPNPLSNGDSLFFVTSEVVFAATLILLTHHDDLWCRLSHHHWWLLVNGLLNVHR